MITTFTLYHGGGAHDWSSGDLVYSTSQATKLFAACSKILDYDFDARDILENGNFELRYGLNAFGDEFYVLTKKVDLDGFLQFQDEEKFSGRRVAYKHIAEAFARLGQSVRFIGVELRIDDDIAPVESPDVSLVQAPAVAAALSDAETLIQSGNFVGAIDRVHTALHGYARSLCVEAGITLKSEVVELPRAIKLLRETHPMLKATGPHSEHFEKVLNAIGVICNSLGTLRNHGSLAHANHELLGAPEALLVANTTRTILRYLSDKVQSPQKA